MEWTSNRCQHRKIEKLFFLQCKLYVLSIIYSGCDITLSLSYLTDSEIKRLPMNDLSLPFGWKKWMLFLKSLSVKILLLNWIECRHSNSKHIDWCVIRSSKSRLIWELIKKKWQPWAVDSCPGCCSAILPRSCKATRLSICIVHCILLPACIRLVSGLTFEHPFIKHCWCHLCLLRFANQRKSKEMAKSLNPKLTKLFDQKERNLFCDITLTATQDGLE